MPEYDLVICGGGTAGVAAGYTAAKLGMKTLIIEKNIHLGGTITSALVIPAMKSVKKNINCDFYNDFVVAYVIPASDGKLSSDVLYQEFHKIPGSCFNYVFYDKGAYSDGWRYIEICPIEQEGIYGLKGTITTAVESGLGQGVENTNKIASSISSTNSVISESSAAQNALNFVYVNMDDWYLPSIDELKEAKKVYPELFSMFSDYWSSTEKDSEEAYTLRWSRDKDSELKYFVVRRF